MADVVQQVEAGDDVLFLGHVRHLDHDPEAAPLLYAASIPCRPVWQPCRASCR
ncbi:MAG: flavin reductase family protein [Paenirhodobacter sp.]